MKIYLSWWLKINCIQVVERNKRSSEIKTSKRSVGISDDDDDDG